MDFAYATLVVTADEIEVTEILTLGCLRVLHLSNVLAQNVRARAEVTIYLTQLFKIGREQRRQKS